jgi:DNA polymerase V
MCKIFSLVDCNNFYTSCERIFNPSLYNKPIVVLSNNDGCIIARSNEAKRLGIPMGAPYHRNKHLIEQNQVKVFSSNYQLYGDISQRIMKSLSMFVPKMEVYSIDEAFLRLDNFCGKDPLSIASELYSRILKWIGIPTSHGIAPTKTLAKIANKIAKDSTKENIFDMRSIDLQTKVLKDLPIEDIWGISSGWGNKLRTLGIKTALELRETEPRFIRNHLSVVGERIVYELRGFPCIDLEQMPQKKNILSSKSFGQLITELEQIEEALANYTFRACEKLRIQNSKTQGIHVFLKTNKYMLNDPQYHNSMTKRFIHPSSDTAFIIRTAKLLLRQMYKKGFKYQKCGIILLNLVSQNYEQYNLLEKPPCERKKYLSHVIDKINQTVGSGSLFYASQGIKRNWAMRCNKRSPRYTTQWEELARAY